MAAHRLRRAAEGALDAVAGNPSDDFFRALAAHAPMGVLFTDPTGECCYVNARLCDLTGLSPEQSLGSGWMTAVHPDDAERVRDACERTLAGGTGFSTDCRFRRPDGRITRVDASLFAALGEDEQVIGWVGTCVDATLRGPGEDGFRELFEHAQDAVYTADMEGNVTIVNHAAEQLTGYSRAELTAMNLFDLIASDDSERMHAALARKLQGKDEITEVYLVTKDGKRICVEVASRYVFEDGVPVRMEGIARDITERRGLQEKLAYQAFHDALTGLPNRLLLLDRLGRALAIAERSGSRVAVMLLDLDNFKLVNDSLGHLAGDELLMKISPRLAAEMRGSDTVARLGGDEFAFVLEGITREHELIPVAKRILSVFADPFVIAGSRQHVTASLGVVLAEPGSSPDTLLRSADTAMYRAKTTSRGGFEVFDERMRVRVVREVAVTNDLADALQNGQLVVHYQPIVSLIDGRTLAVEALARWRHAQWGWVAPDEFIPIAERNDLIVPLERYVLNEAARQARVWRDRYPGMQPTTVFVNISPQQLTRSDFIRWFTKTVESHGLVATDIGIEVTERAFIDETDGILVANMRELARVGVQLSLDDFGTGYSALASLKRFPFTMLKIDRYFIEGIHVPVDEAPITAAIIGLGNALGLTVIAEGVEEEHQAERLRRLGCHAAQGFYFARPQPADELSALLETNTTISA